MTYVIRGDNIYGTVWLCGNDPGFSWTRPFNEGVREFNTRKEGNDIAQRLRDANMDLEIDSRIAYIEVITKPTSTDKALTTKEFLDRFDKELLPLVNQEINVVKEANPACNHYHTVVHAIEGVSEARELPVEIINALDYYYRYDQGSESEAENRYFESQLCAIKQRSANKPEDADSFYERCEQFRPADDES